MKHLTILTTVLLALFVFTTQSMAQQVQPTAKAKKAFQKKFPNARNVSWGKETQNVFEAEFTLHGKHISANFDKQGNWKETETPIPNRKLPNAVKRAYKKGHKMAALKQAFKVAQPGKTVYELEVGSGELVYTSNGKVVNEGEENGEAMESGESGESSEYGEANETGERGESGEQGTTQQTHPTAQAKHAFQQKFPNARNVSWGKETPNVFEAEFTLHGKHVSANFDKQGNWKETKTPIPNRKLPNAVKRAYKKGHKMAALKQAFKVAQPGKTVYELEVKMNGNENSGIYELVYTSNGKLVNEGSESGEAGESTEGSGW
jgi:hypothetical protein